MDKVVPRHYTFLPQLVSHLWAFISPSETSEWGLYRNLGVGLVPTVNRTILASFLGKKRGCEASLGKHLCPLTYALAPEL